MASVQERIHRIIRQQLGVLNFSTESKLVADLGADSLDLIELLMEIEDEFGIELADEEFTELLSVGNVVEFVEKKIHG